MPVGGRVAIVSQNSARLLTSFFGVCGWGRVLVPVNFRLACAEIRYIIEHSGAEVVYVDPALKAHARRDRAPAQVRAGRGRRPDLPDAEPQPWAGDEGATATINYTSGTTARPKGVQLTHRNLWLNATVFALQAGVSDRDVYLHTLPMFHANGWGMPFALTGMGVQHIVLRQVDGTEILKRIEEHGVTVMCAAPAVVDAALDGAETWDGEIPGRDRVRIIVAGAPPPTRTIERVRDELGWEFIQIYGLTETSPLLTIAGMRAEWDDLDRHERRATSVGPAPRRSACASTVDDEGEVLAASNHNLEAYWDNPEATAEAQAGNWFHTGDGGTLETTATSRSPTARRTSSSPAARTSPRSRSRTR